MFQSTSSVLPDNFSDSENVIRILIPALGIHEYLDKPMEVNPHFALFAGKFLLELGNSANIDYALQSTTDDLNYLSQDKVENYMDDITTVMERMGEHLYHYLSQVTASYMSLVAQGESPFVEIDILPDTLAIIIYT